MVNVFVDRKFLDMIRKANDILPFELSFKLLVGVLIFVVNFLYFLYFCDNLSPAYLLVYYKK